MKALIARKLPAIDAAYCTQVRSWSYSPPDVTTIVRLPSLYWNIHTTNWNWYHLKKTKTNHHTIFSQQSTWFASLAVSPHLRKPASFHANKLFRDDLRRDTVQYRLMAPEWWAGEVKICWRFRRPASGGNLRPHSAMVLVSLPPEMLSSFSPAELATIYDYTGRKDGKSHKLPARWESLRLLEQRCEPDVAEIVTSRMSVLDEFECAATRGNPTTPFTADLSKLVLGR